MCNNGDFNKIVKTNTRKVQNANKKKAAIV
jgi:hypothetical protein